MLQGVYHQPYAYDDLYSTQPTERMPRDPMEGDTVLINATSWPIESGQTVWITWTKNGVAQPVIGASWQYNDGNNSYWQASLGRFTPGLTHHFSLGFLGFSWKIQDIHMTLHE